MIVDKVIEDFKVDSSAFCSEEDVIRFKDVDCRQNSQELDLENEIDLFDLMIVVDKKVHLGDRKN